MKSLLQRIAVGTAGLVLAAAPLAASAQTWHDHNRDRGGYHDNDRGRDGDRGRVYDRERDYNRGDYRRTVYQQPYADGYFGWAPGGFQGYYSNGGWYQHRRWSGGIWIYF